MISSWEISLFTVVSHHINTCISCDSNWYYPLGPPSMYEVWVLLWSQAVLLIQSKISISEERQCEWLFFVFVFVFFALYLYSAISFLIETGTLLHFPDTSHGLCTLYFLCPVWLSECLERIMHLKSSRSVARNGVIRTEDLRVRLRKQLVKWKKF